MQLSSVTLLVLRPLLLNADTSTDTAVPSGGLAVAVAGPDTAASTTAVVANISVLLEAIDFVNTTLVGGWRACCCAALCNEGCPHTPLLSRCLRLQAVAGSH